MKIKLLYSSLLLFIFSCGTNLTYHQINSGTYNSDAHSRGLGYQNDVLVVAGSNGYFKIQDLGTYARLDTTGIIAGIEDIRDVEVLEDNSIFLLNSGEKGLILKKKYGVNRMDTVYFEEGVFLDGMSFWKSEPHIGLAFGDPIDNKMHILKINSTGDSVKVIDKVPLAQDGEAGFAASGTSIQVIENTPIAYIGSGGCENPRLYFTNDFGETWSFRDTPMKGGASNGIYSLYFWNENEGIIIGGSYVDSTDNERMCFYTGDGGKTWVERNKGLPGYCSGISGDENGDFIVATGRNGTYYTLDQGKHWKLLFHEAYYSVIVKENKMIFSGKGGKWSVWEYSGI